MSQTHSIKLKLRYVNTVLRDDLKSIREIDIPYKSIENNLNRWQRVILEGNLNDSQIIKLL